MPDMKNLAYDLSLFETSQEEEEELELKRKKEAKIIRFTEKNRKEKRNNITFRITSISMSIICIVLLGFILYGQVTLTEMNQQIINLKSELEEKQSVYTQAEMKVEAKLSPEVIEEYATNVLKMTKVESNRIEFIKLSEGDKAEIADKKNKDFGELVEEILEYIW